MLYFGVASATRKPCIEAGVRCWLEVIQCEN